MIKSMTGFGRCEVQKESRKFTVELKGVNHRYLDVNIRMPKKLNFFETSIRTLLKKYANRGKIDIFITYEDTSENQVSLKYNASLAAEYLKYLKQMEEEFGLENDVRVSTLSRYPEVITMEEQCEDEEELWNGLEEALKGAFLQFVETRTNEGENLRNDILEKLEGILKSVLRRLLQNTGQSWRQRFASFCRIRRLKKAVLLRKWFFLLIRSVRMKR